MFASSSTYDQIAVTRQQSITDKAELFYNSYTVITVPKKYLATLNEASKHYFKYHHNITNSFLKFLTSFIVALLMQRKSKLNIRRTESNINEMLLNLPDEYFTLHTHTAIVFLACKHLQPHLTEDYF